MSKQIPIDNSPVPMLDALGNVVANQINGQDNAAYQYNLIRA